MFIYMNKLMAIKFGLAQRLALPKSDLRDRYNHRKKIDMPHKRPQVFLQVSNYDQPCQIHSFIQLYSFQLS